jgi:hypothetical protein
MISVEPLVDIDTFCLQAVSRYKFVTYSQSVYDVHRYNSRKRRTIGRYRVVCRYKSILMPLIATSTRSLYNFVPTDGASV